MFDKALIDGDIVNYRCAAANEHEEEGLACWQAGEMVNRIMLETNSVQHKIYLTGNDNFRFSIYPEYKANRKDSVKPKHHGAIREYLATYLGAIVTDGYEADDAMAMEQDDRSVICSIDKDLLMVPGYHYNFVTKDQRLVSPLDGMRHFYYQLIMGDKVDNIFGYDGKARPKVPQFLRPVIDELYAMTEEQEMYDLVASMYDDVERMHINGKCLWLWRFEGDTWKPPHERTLDGGEAESLHNLGTEGLQSSLPGEV